MLSRCKNEATQKPRFLLGHSNTSYKAFCLKHDGMWCTTGWNDQLAVKRTLLCSLRHCCEGKAGQETTLENSPVSAEPWWYFLLALWLALYNLHQWERRQHIQWLHRYVVAQLKWVDKLASLLLVYRRRGQLAGNACYNVYAMWLIL